PLRAVNQPAVEPSLPMFISRPEGLRRRPMLRWAVIFLIIALVAALFGFTDIASASAGIAKILFGIFLLIFVLALVLGLMGASRLRA
ncbi:MAG: DUF1328 domain-containing protein, partial [Panacagrimonas sp.]